LQQQVGDAQLAGFRHSPRNERLAAHAVAKLGFLLEHQDARAAARHGNGQRRSAHAAAYRDYVKGIRVCHWSST
jgi:hypothetical protein